MKIAVRPRQRLDNGRAAPFWQTVPEMVHIPTGSARCEVSNLVITHMPASHCLPWQPSCSSRASVCTARCWRGYVLLCMHPQVSCSMRYACEGSRRLWSHPDQRSGH